MLWKTCIALSLIVGTKLFYDVIVRFNVCLRKKVQRNGMVKIMSSISSIEKNETTSGLSFNVKEDTHTKFGGSFLVSNFGKYDIIY
jgi:hypothetical protein